MFEVADDVEEGFDGDGVVAGFVGDVDGDGDALGWWFGPRVLPFRAAGPGHWSLTSATAARAA